MLLDLKIISFLILGLGLVFVRKSRRINFLVLVVQVRVVVHGAGVAFLKGFRFRIDTPNSTIFGLILFFLKGLLTLFWFIPWTLNAIGLYLRQYDIQRLFDDIL